MSNYSHFLDRPIFKQIGQAADHLGLECYVVGGYVRDRLIERPTKMDLDFVTVGSGIALAKEVRKGFDKKPKLSVFKSFGTAHMNYQGVDLEFVGARKESYKRNSRNPIVEDGTLEDDQNRRDFTINAMAICLNEGRWGELIDPFNGVADLERKLIKTPLSPDKTFDDDPLRMMRAVRFAAQLDYRIDSGTLKSIRAHASRLKIVAPERISVELNKIMEVDKPSYGLGLLFTSGLMKEILPEICALQGVEEVEGHLHKDNFYHTLEVVDNLARTSENLWLRWAALLHDIGKPVTKRFDEKVGWTFHAHEFVGSKMVPKIFKRLHLPQNEKMKFVRKLVMLSSRPVVLSQEDVTEQDYFIQQEQQTGDPRWINPVIEQNAQMTQPQPDEQAPQEEDPFKNIDDADKSEVRERLQKVREAELIVKQMEEKKGNRSLQDEAKYKSALQIVAKNKEQLRKLGFDVGSK